ncbi:hypothetical protein RJ639_046097 [Escallonia herrerae]|uniref:Uncharacterized protein n=1 Tax=Escallonia herrerae TaxID=1293975 RepID=A0AA89B3Y9_9ASTE|nr:hypothetical protein RJ639_046097 [Escallonia herrerae]
MAAESNLGFHHSLGCAPMNRHHSKPFQPSARGSSTAEMILMGNCYSAVGSTVFPNSNNPAGMSKAQASSSSLLVDTLPGLKHDAGLAVEWSIEEQYKLEEGLVKYADEPSIMRYIKIAAMLHDKTVRDVALRCRWMTRKRRKQEDNSLGKKVKDRKDKLGESSSKMIMSLAPPSNVAYPLMMHHLDQRHHVPYEALSGNTWHLLEQNNQVLGQISANLSMLKLQDNIDLLCLMRNNITSILDDMRDMPGMMSRMPPLPLCINEELANSILPGTSQVITCV